MNDGTFGGGGGAFFLGVFGWVDGAAGGAGGVGGVELAGGRGVGVLHRGTVPGGEGTKLRCLPGF